MPRNQSERTTSVIATKTITARNGNLFVIHVVEAPGAGWWTVVDCGVPVQGFRLGRWRKKESALACFAEVPTPFEWGIFPIADESNTHRYGMWKYFHAGPFSLRWLANYIKAKHIRNQYAP